MEPTKGRIVHFLVDEMTANELNSRNDGNSVKAGDVLPAVIVQVWGSNCCNLRVLRDAQSDAWITSVTHSQDGTLTRSWAWPPRV